jgi:hypothetical protein
MGAQLAILCGGYGTINGRFTIRQCIDYFNYTGKARTSVSYSRAAFCAVYVTLL